MMHKISTFLIGFLLILSSCSDSIDAPPSNDDNVFVGTTFETEGQFTPENGYSFVFDFAENGFRPFESDAVLAYRLENHSNGEDIWSPLPRTTFLDDGRILIYNYVFNSSYDGDLDDIFDVTFFLEGNFNIAELAPTRTEVFKIVVVPSDFLNTNAVDINNINTVLQSKAIQFEDYNL
ncbi:hypothetical protein [Saccharicrinis aurantiacus]|uniref:hypothetical protein n=1 Tax=Saccharicrinis aurantiacus TaxID=1849719 RepID=UPI00094F876C|nr:hypothetical protein [Saccharicrinis aurantiacus]